MEKTREKVISNLILSKYKNVLVGSTLYLLKNNRNTIFGFYVYFDII